MSKLKPNEVMDAETGEIVEVYWPVPPQLSEDGRSEILNSKSLVTVYNDKPLSVGERIRRYTGNLGQLQEFQYDEEDLEPDEMADMDESPLSKYEDRAGEITRRVRERKDKEKSEEQIRIRDEETKRKNDLREAIRELSREAATPPPAEGE